MLSAHLGLCFMRNIPVITPRTLAFIRVSCHTLTLKEMFIYHLENKDCHAEQTCLTEL